MVGTDILTAKMNMLGGIDSVSQREFVLPPGRFRLVAGPLMCIYANSLRYYWGSFGGEEFFIL